MKSSKRSIVIRCIVFVIAALIFRWFSLPFTKYGILNIGNIT